MTDAAEAIRNQPNQDNHSAPWWSEKSHAARKTYHKARRDNPGDILLEERRDFLRVVREEKGSYWQSRIDGVRSDKELYEIVQWHKLGPAISSPPLVLDGRVIINITEKANMLK